MAVSEERDTPLCRAQAKLGRRLDQFARDLKRDPGMRKALEGDGSLFTVVLMAMVARTVVHTMAPYSKLLREPGGAEKFVKVAQDQLADFLRPELAALLEHEAKQPRH